MNRFLKITALGSIVVFMLAVVLLRTWSSAAAVGSSSGTWKIVACAKPSSNGGYLAGISAVSASDIWAVGTYTPDHSPDQEGLVEHWDGTQWSVVPSPNPAGIGSGFSAVSAFSSNDAWAVGSYETANSVSFTLIEHWNGTQWSIVPSPNSGSFFNHLAGVTAISSNNAWAVGIYGGPDSRPNPAGTLIEHWDGRQWSIVPNPTSLNGGAALGGVAATSNNPSRPDIWAIGDIRHGTSNPPPQGLIERWNGRQWNIVPSPTSADGNSLLGIAVLASNDVWVVGNKSADFTLTEHWNGRLWSVFPSPNLSSLSNTLYSVTATSSTDVWAVGSYLIDGDNGFYRTLIEHWDGSHWSIVSSPNDGTSNNFLYGVTRVPGMQQMWAVGKGDQIYTEFYS
jgi:hypothetical protein